VLKIRHIAKPKNVSGQAKTTKHRDNHKEKFMPIEIKEITSLSDFIQKNNGIRH